jgi:hypothetical protein
MLPFETLTMKSTLAAELRQIAEDAPRLYVCIESEFPESFLAST